MRENTEPERPARTPPAALVTVAGFDFGDLAVAVGNSVGCKPLSQYGADLPFYSY